MLVIFIVCLILKHVVLNLFACLVLEHVGLNLFVLY